MQNTSFSKNTPLVDYSLPNKCPYCGKDLAIAPDTQASYVQPDLFLIDKCYHCSKPILTVYDSVSNQTALSFPLSSPQPFRPEIQELSPHYCMILKQTLVAKELHLDSLVGPGLRISLEWLLWDYLTKLKNISAEELKHKKLAARTSYLQNDLIKLICADIVRIFGNDTIHIFSDDKIDEDAALLAINQLSESIAAEIILSRVHSQR